PPVVVVVKEGATGSGSLRKVVLRGLTAGMLPSNPANLGRNNLEGASCGGQGVGEAGQASYRECASQRIEEFATGREAISTQSLWSHRAHKNVASLRGARSPA